MRRVIFVALAVFVLLAQVSLLPAARPLGVVPNLALVFVVLVGLESTSSLAVLAAVVLGITLDLSSGANLGLWTGTLLLAALVTGLLHRAGLETDGPLVPAAMVAAGTLLTPVIVLTGLVNTAADLPVATLLGRFAGELVLNLGLMMLVRPLVRRLVPQTPTDAVTMG